MNESFSAMTVRESVPRLEQIERILHGLTELDSNQDTQYAKEQSIAFFTAAKSIWTYSLWLFKYSGKLDGNRLLEINELLPGLDEEMHHHLTRIGRRKFPGLLRPIIERMTSNILCSKDSQVRVIDVGSGGMEIERQIIQALSKKSLSRVTFVGADISVDALSRAAKNIAEIGSGDVCVQFVERLNQVEIEEIERSTEARFLVLLCRIHVDELLKTCPRNYFSFAFTSLFLHHVPLSERSNVLNNIATLAGDVVHYDGYRSFLNLIPQSIIAWQHPVFLNAAIFSNLRYMNKRELRDFHPKSQLTFCPHGHYLSENLSS